MGTGVLKDYATEDLIHLLIHRRACLDLNN